MTTTNEQRKDRQRKAVLLLDRLIRLTQDGKADPPVSGLSVRVMKTLLIHDDGGGTGMTSRQLEDATGVSQSNLSRALRAIPQILQAHCADAGVLLHRALAEGEQHAAAHRLIWGTPCPVCQGSGICEPEEVEP
jgi:hypothetical protein